MPTDGSVGVQASATPDHYIDNDTGLDDSGITVYRQRVVFPPYRQILDYDVRTDTNPVYVGTNIQSALIADTTWTIKKLFYDSSNRLVDVQVIQGVAWTARTTLSWRSSAGN